MLKQWVTIITWVVLCHSSFAEPIKWEIHFFDQDRNKIGSGTFLYDTDTSYRFYDEVGSTYDFNVDSYVSHFDVQLRNIPVPLFFESWWADNTGSEIHDAGSLYYNRYLQQGRKDNKWYVGNDPSSGNNGVMEFEVITEDLAFGTFQFFYNTAVIKQLKNGIDPECQCETRTRLKKNSVTA